MAKRLPHFCYLLCWLIPSCLGDLSIENEYIGFTVDTGRGCALNSIWAVGDPAKTNLVNTYDLGRYIQASYYSGPQGYEGCEWSGSEWSWNPIAAGDAFGNPSAVLSTNVLTNTSITCTMIPMQWACDNIPCECTVDISYTLEDASIKSSVILNNNRSDDSDYGPYSQEAPAVYVNAFLDRLIGYEGSDPCSDSAGDVTEFDAVYIYIYIYIYVSGDMFNYFVAFHKFFSSSFVLDKEKYKITIYSSIILSSLF
mmetsp:Transcript_38672/g.50030  ORF Transcript_38672/g.50030 Transcript_38672/m.50030 type:complete len:254 (+) Transcript_38672:25-786(+)